MEAVLLSVTPGYLVSIRKIRPGVANRLQSFKENIEEPLSAILSLNTIAHTVGAAGAGAQAARVFGSNWVGLFSALLTLAILFLSEIIPKTIGAVYWKQLAPGVTRLLAWLMVPLKPFVWLSAVASHTISSEHDPVHVSRDEIRALAHLGAEQGVLDEDESRVVESLLRFRSMTVSQVMTPRTVIFGLPAEDTVGKTVEQHQPLRYSRIPVFQGSIDQLVGFVLKDEILERAARGETDTPLVALRRELFCVPGTLRLSQLLDLFLSSREHIAAVVDEFGGTAGLVTLEDLIETLLDLEIVDEIDNVEDLRAAARLKWRHRAKELGIVIGDHDPSRP
jgi:CBS domain containing-hemolysin-like protein